MKNINCITIPNDIETIQFDQHMLNGKKTPYFTSGKRKEKVSR